MRFSRFLFVLSIALVLLEGAKCIPCTEDDPEDPNNIMCYKIDQCTMGNKLTQSGPTASYDKVSIVHFHNTLRNLVAKGQMTDHPKAKNLPQILWDDKLADAATLYAGQCLDPIAQKAAYNYRDEIHDSYMVMEYLRLYKPEENVMPYYYLVSRDLFKPVCERRFGASNIQPISYSRNSKKWAQIIYEGFTTIGCAYSQFTKTGKHYAGFSFFYHVCFYGGKVPEVGGALYEVGEKENCEVPSLVYDGLCSTKKVNFHQRKDPCQPDQEFFINNYHVLCDKNNTLWFCDGKEIKKMEEKYPIREVPTEVEQEHQDSIIGKVVAWTVGGFVGVSGVGSAVWYFWEDIIDFVDDLF